MLIFSNTTERGTEYLHPLNEATATGNGWQLNGTKYFVNIPSLTTHVPTNARMRDTDSDPIANILIPMNTEAPTRQSIGMPWACVFPNEVRLFWSIKPWLRFRSAVLFSALSRLHSNLRSTGRRQIRIP